MLTPICTSYPCRYGWAKRTSFDGSSATELDQIGHTDLSTEGGNEVLVKGRDVLQAIVFVTEVFIVED